MGFKDNNWSFSPNSLGKYSYEQAQLAVLIDIREQLRTLNNLLGCINFRDIPRKLDVIKKNTAKPRKRRKKL